MIVSNTSTSTANQLNRVLSNAQDSITRISTGNRIVKASDDVAGLSIGTSLSSDVRVLQIAQIATNQAQSMLGIADGALAEISEILQRQKSLATQSNSGALTDVERQYLDEEFQSLKAEVDRLVGATEFNGQKLINGDLFAPNAVFTQAETAQIDSSTGVATIDITNLTDSQTLNLNGVTLTADLTTTVTESVDYYINNKDNVLISADVGGTTFDLDVFGANLVKYLNSTNDGRLMTATYSYDATNDILTITSKNTSTSAAHYTIDTSNVAAGASINNGPTSVTAGTFTGLTSTELAKLSYSIKGDIGDSLLTALGDQRQSSETVTFATNDLDDDATLVVNGVELTIQDSAGYNDPTSQILQGSNETETVQNIFNFLQNNTNAAIGVADYAINSADPLAIDVTYKQSTSRGNSFVITPAGSNAVSLAGGLTGSVDISTITNNKDFIGTLSGFKVEHLGADNKIGIKIEVGDYTYNAVGTNNLTPYDDISSNPSEDTRIYFQADDVKGGLFSITIAGNEGLSVTSQDDANDFATRLDKAFSTLEFQQNREISSYVAVGDIKNSGHTSVGSLTGTKFELNTSDFSDIEISDIRISGPVVGGTDAILEFDIDGETYRSSPGIGNTVAANTKLEFTSTANPNNVLSFHNGATMLEITSTDNAQSIQDALKEAFGINSGNTTVSFQVGIESNQTIDIAIRGAKTTDLYKDENNQYIDLNIKTADNAKIAGDILSGAIEHVTGIRAGIGSFQSRFDSAAKYLDTAIQNQDKAASEFLVTDTASEMAKLQGLMTSAQGNASMLAKLKDVQDVFAQILRQ